MFVNNQPCREALMNPACDDPAGSQITMAAAGVPQSVSRDKDQGIPPEKGDRKGPAPCRKNKGLAVARKA